MLLHLPLAFLVAASSVLATTPAQIILASRTRPSTPVDRSSHHQHDKPSSKKVSLQFGVMSRCPDALYCETLFNSVLSRVGALVDVELLFIATIDAAASPYGVTSKHGPLEVEGDVQQLCIAKHWNQHSPSSSSLPLDSFEIQPLHSHTEAWRDAWKFLQCVNRSFARVGQLDLLVQCSHEVGRDPFDPALQSCLKNERKEGSRLIQHSVTRTAAMGITKSCSILIEGKIVCIHDSDWYDCSIGHSVDDFVLAIEEAYAAKQDQSQ